MDSLTLGVKICKLKKDLEKIGLSPREAEEYITEIFLKGELFQRP